MVKKKKGHRPRPKLVDGAPLFWHHYSNFNRQRQVFKTRNSGLTNLSTESEVMSNERQFKRSASSSENCLDLPLIIFIGSAYKIKRVHSA